MPEPDSVAWWQLASDAMSERAAGPTTSEQEIIRLFDQLRSPLLRYLLAFGLLTQDSEEVIQEVFLALYQHLERGRSRQNLRGWVFRVAHNLGLKRRLARAREASNVLVSGDALAASVPDPTANPEEQLLSTENHQRLQAILRALPEQDQWCLSLRAEGLRYREIAEILDVSLASVSAALARSLARFSRASVLSQKFIDESPPSGAVPLDRGRRPRRPRL
jgi:RNA polymerase sigma-70 factor (ECF subfamily)